MVLYYGLIQCITASNCSLGAHWPTWAAVQLSASDARTSGRHCCAAPTPKPVVTFNSVSLYLNQPSPDLQPTPLSPVLSDSCSYITQQRCWQDLLCDPPPSSVSLCIELHTVVSLTHKVVFGEGRQGETATTRHQKAVFVYFSLLYFYFPFLKHIIRLCLLVLSSPHNHNPSNDGYKQRKQTRLNCARESGICHTITAQSSCGKYDAIMRSPSNVNISFKIVYYWWFQNAALILKLHTYG